MKKLCIVLAVIVAAAATPLMAQFPSDCGSTCDPYNGLASTSCGYCADMIDHIDQCYDYEWTTCGDYMNAGLADNCSPFWVVTSDVTVGQYGTADYGWNNFRCTYGPEFACEHHKVDRVGLHDANQCNINPDFYDTTTCTDNVDYWSGWHCEYQNCCAYPFYCNDWHSCY